MSLKIVYKALIAAAYAFLFWFVFYVINPLCYNIFQQQAFVLTADFFWTTVKVPGGLAEYLSLFVEQFTMFRFWGALLLVVELFATAWLTIRYVRGTIGENIHFELSAHLLAVGLMFSAWVNVKYAFAINMQALLLVLVLNIQQIIDKYPWRKYATALLAVFIYFACGPVALYLFTLCNIILYVVGKGQISNLISVTVVAALLPFVTYQFLLPISSEAAFYLTVPQKPMYTAFGFSFQQLLALVYIPVALLLGFAGTKWFASEKPTAIAIALPLLICGGSVWLTKKYDNPMERLSFKMEVAVYQNDWDQIIRYVNDNPEVCERENYDRYVNFYYNMALAKKNQLGEKIFTYPQLLGNKALFIDEPVATSVCLPLAMFYYNAGLITNSLRFAFEAQTTYTTSHYVMRYVIDCLIIIGDNQSAAKFLAQYEKNMLSCKYVEERKKMILEADSVDYVSDSDFSRSVVQGIRAAHPTDDFYMQNEQNNMLKLLRANRNNQMAGQYLACSALLNNDLEQFVQIIKSGLLNIDYNNMPRAYQEAILLYRASTKNVEPEIQQISISPFVQRTFSEFAKLMASKMPDRNQMVALRFPKTYWKYYFVDNPINADH
ncbi:MAG: hypothetical protein IKW86_12320 [Salinivirgaceae bacterium]|nr:hypothetical protein [Salinivirgaceae bacterium]